MDDSTLSDDSHTFDRFRNRLNHENKSLDQYEDDLTNKYLQELTSNERAKKSCDNILHVLQDGRHSVIQTELDNYLREFDSLKYRYEEQKIYHEMFAFMQKLIYDYTYHKSGMVKKWKIWKKQINENITRIKRGLSKYQEKHALKDITYVDQMDNTWYDDDDAIRPSIFLWHNSIFFIVLFLLNGYWIRHGHRK